MRRILGFQDSLPALPSLLPKCSATEGVDQDRRREGAAFTRLRVRLREGIEARLNKLDEQGESVRVDPATHIEAAKGWREGAKQASIEYLDVDTHLGWGKGGWLELETGIFRKKAAADNYLHFNSAHPESLKSGMVRGELCRYLTRASTEERFESAWVRFRGALMKRGYPAHWLDRTRGALRWSDRAGIMTRMDEKRAAKKEGGLGGEGGCAKALVVVIESRPGVQEWWRDCRLVDDLLDLGWLGGEKVDLPPKFMLCLSRTENLGSMVKGARKADEAAGRGGAGGGGGEGGGKEGLKGLPRR